MRRADRLFRITEYLKARRTAVTAKILAQELEVSERTIYRDIADLGASGVPVVGEAGVGYMLDRSYVVRPLMFEVEELDSLALGARMVESWGDKALAKAARRSLDKIMAVLPESLRAEMLSTAMFSHPSQARPVITIDFTALRRAIRTRNIIEFLYAKENGEQSRRRVRPLSLVFFGPVWLLMGWCETRDDFRNFRLDRIKELVITDKKFLDEKGKRLSDFLKNIGKR